MRKLKIFSTPWHVSHQHSLTKLPNTQWYYLRNNVRQWSTVARPLPENMEWVSYYEPNKYDLAILHIDQQCVWPEYGKSILYENLNRIIQDIPKIVVNHGTPFWPEKIDTNTIINGGYAIEGGRQFVIQGMKKLVGDSYMVVNSYKAAEQWGWGTPIWHGIPEGDFKPLTKEPRSITTQSPAGLDYYYNRPLLTEVKSILQNKYNWPHIQIGSDYLCQSFKEYRDKLGSAAVYVNVTKESPMPRGRTEAMLSGCCILTTPYQDADKFIESGKNGFIIPDNPEVIAELTFKLCNENFRVAKKIGEEGRKTALKLFSMKRYIKEWEGVLNEVLGKTKK
jgi:glycosyltransferase involved in cell wall biosynthesis